MSDPLEQLLPVVRELDGVLDRLLPAGDITLRSIEGQGIIAFAPGPARALENLWLARRTLVGFFVLGSSTLSTKADHTETMAVLSRRLLELAAQTMWLTDFPVPPKAEFPVPLGSADSLLSDGSPTAWPRAVDRYAFAICLCAATEWVDAQALRSQLDELHDQLKTGESIYDLAESYETKGARKQG